MSESVDGVSVSCTRQNAGSPVIGRGVAVLSAGGVNEPAGTAVAAVTFALVSFSVAATRAQSCADATTGASVSAATIKRSFIRVCRVQKDPASTSSLHIYFVLRTSPFALPQAKLAASSMLPLPL